MWVKDASRAVGVMQSLLSADLRAPFVASVEADYAEVRSRHANRGDAKPLLSLARSREKKFDGGWDEYAPPAPLRAGRDGVRRRTRWHDLRAIIDWTPFFQTWELSGRYPQILDDAVVGAQARELFADAQAMLDQIIAEKWLTAKAVAGLWPAHSIGDDVHLDSAARPLHFLRQQADKPDDRANFSLADFVAPRGQRPRRTGSAASRSTPASASSRTWRASRRSTTTTTLDPAEVARRPLRGSLRGVAAPARCAPSCGATRRTRRSTRRRW